MTATRLLSTAFLLNTLKIFNLYLSIVAVHGLGANPDYAWVWLPKNNPVGATGYPDKPFNWLEKLLPQELACRVMTFNYNSNWFLNAPQLRVSSISDCLLESLQILRKEVSLVRCHNLQSSLPRLLIVSSSY